MTPDRPVVLVPIRQLKPNVRNARTHRKRDTDAVVDSIKHFGWTMPMLVDEHNNVLAGHLRLEAAKKLGLHRVPAITLSGLSETEKRALALADNKIASKAGWDRGILAAELGELSILLPEMGLDISLTGFEPFELDTLVTDAGELGSADADAIPRQRPWPSVNQATFGSLVSIVFRAAMRKAPAISGC